MRSENLMFWPLLALLFLGNPPTVAAPHTTTRKGGSRWGANYFPNVALITHQGKRVRFFDDLIKGKVVVINFIYTSCPDSCPLETARLAEVQAILGDRVGRDVFMYSITIDPQHDTPEVLKKYAERYQIAPGWLFLTGKEADITLLRKKLGLYIPEIQDGSNDHNLSLIIGNQATGQWMKSSPFENPYVVAGQIGGQLHNWKLPDSNRNSYADAPKLRNLTKGENLFRTRCAACHTIGGGDVSQPDQKRVGPDLLGVMQMRDRAWIARWLAEPEKMLAEKDPIAMGMYAKYNNVAMPNMRLNPIEVDRLIQFIDTESHRVEKTRQIKTVAQGPDSGAPKSCCTVKKDKGHDSSENERLVVSTGEPLEPNGGAPLVRIASEGPNATARPGEGTEIRTRRSGFLRTRVIFYSGLGGVFLLLATVRRRLASTSV